MIRLAVRCDPELAERVLAELVELVPGGVEEERGRTYVEYAIYGPPGELPALPELRAAAGEGLVAIETTEVPDDWADRWRDFHEPVWVGSELVVRPSWIERPEPPASGEGRPLEIVIDPGQAFGTGAHATTGLCLELLIERAREHAERGSVADLGTGSGVLAIAASLLGFAPVLACDHELPAVEAAAANAELNEAEVEVERLNLREQPAPAAELWLANLTAPLLLRVAELLPESAGRPRELIVSGLLRGEAADVVAAFAERGYAERRGRRERGDWAALGLVAEREA